MGKEPLESRVVRSAEAALADQKYVSAIDVLLRMSLLSDSALKEWRRGGAESLESVLQGHPTKISDAMVIFRNWAQHRGLKPSETTYIRQSRDGYVDLRFTLSGDPEAERAYRTHYISPELTERKQQNLVAKLNKPDDRVVFSIARESACSECGVELMKGDFLIMEANQPLCLQCAGLGDLEYLPAGDAALTRRATKYSQSSVVVVQFSRSRGRYERIGILVEVPALHRAEEECAADAEDRARQRERSAEKRLADDVRLVDVMSKRIREIVPGCPPDEARAIAAWTAVRGSGRVGRSSAGRALAEDALRLAVAASVRHRHTDYDNLLRLGWERGDARAKVRPEVAEILERWER
jgi:hypothetical protein